MKVADIFKIYENTLSGYQKQPFPLWIQEYPSARFAATISEVPTALQILQIIRLSLQANIGYIYVLDGGLIYNQLPPLWAQEVAALASYDATGKIPTTVIAPVPSPLPPPLPTPIPTARPIPRPTPTPALQPTPTPILQLTITAQQPAGTGAPATCGA